MKIKTIEVYKEGNYFKAILDNGVESYIVKPSIGRYGIGFETVLLIAEYMSNNRNINSNEYPKMPAKEFNKLIKKGKGKFTYLTIYNRWAEYLNIKTYSDRGDYPFELKYFVNGKEKQINKEVKEKFANVFFACDGSKDINKAFYWIGDLKYTEIIFVNTYKSTQSIKQESDTSSIYKRSKAQTGYIGTDKYFEKIFESGFEYDFVGREKVKKNIDAFIKTGKVNAKNEKSNVLLIIGEPGIGKTTLMKHYLLDKKSGNPHYFIDSKSRELINPKIFLKHIQLFLQNKHNINIANTDGEIGEIIDSLIRTLNEVSERISTTNENEIIYIDGLDNSDLSTRPNIISAVIDIISEFSKNNIKFVITSRDGQFLNQLLLLSKDNHVVLKRDKKNEQDILEFLQINLKLEFSERTIKNILEKTNGNFLCAREWVNYAKTLNELKLDKELSKCPPGLDGIYWLMLENLEETRSEKEREMIRDVMRIIAIAYESMTSEQVLDFCSIDYNDKRRVLGTIEQFFNIVEYKENNLCKYHHVYFDEYIKKTIDRNEKYYHSKIANYYKKLCGNDWENLNDEYGLNYLLKHVAKSNSPKDIYVILNPTYVKNKTRIFLSNGAVVEDIKEAINVAVNEKDIVSAFKYSLLKERTITFNKKSLLCIEAALRVRQGNIDGIFEDILYFGDKNDLILLRAELAIYYWNNNQYFAKEQLLQIEKDLENSPQEILELAIMLIAKIEPNLAIKLTKNIPEPRKSIQYSWKPKLMTKGQCLFRIFEIISKSDLSMASSLAKNMDDVYGKIYAYVALGVAVILSQPLKGVEFFKAGLSYISSEKHQYIYTTFMMRYIFCLIYKLSLEDTIKILISIGDLYFNLLSFLRFKHVLDERINENPILWESALVNFPEGQIKEFITWRLLELGHVSFNDGMLFNDILINEMLRVKEIETFAATMPQKALKLAEGLGTLAGYTSAIAKIAKNIKFKNHKKAEMIIDNAFSSKEIKDDLEGFEAVLELLKVAILIPGETRNKILCWCDRLSNSRQTGSLGVDSTAVFSNLLATEFAKSIPKEDEFFRSLILEFQTEEERARYALLIFENLPYKRCLNILENKEKFNLIIKDGSLFNELNELFLPETKIHLLTYLTAKIIHYNKQIAREHLFETANLLKYVVNEKDKNIALYRITKTAISITPSLVWEMGQICINAPNLLITIVEETLKEFIDDKKDVMETFLHLNLESMFIFDDNDNDNDINEEEREKNIVRNLQTLMDDYLEYKKNSTKRLLDIQAMELSRELPSILETHFDQSEHIRKWICEVPNFLVKFQKDFCNSTDDIDKLLNIVKLIAELDLDIFFNIVAHPNLGASVAQSVGSNELYKCLLKFQGKNESFIDAVLSLQKNSDKSKNGILDSLFCSTIVATSAANDPEACIEMVKAIPNDNRWRFIHELDNIIPGKIWNNNQINRLFYFFDETINSKYSNVAKAKMLGWLGKEANFDEKMIDKICCDICEQSDSYDIRQTAVYLNNFDNNKSEFLLKKALDLSIKNEEDIDVVRILEELHSIRSSIDPHTLKLAVDVAHKNGENQSLSKIAKIQTKSCPEEALITISLIDTNDQDVKETEILEGLANNILLKNEENLNCWISRIFELNNLDQYAKSRFAYYLFKRCISIGIDLPSKTIEYISDLDDKTEILLELAKKNKNDDSKFRSIINKISKDLEVKVSESEESELIQKRARAFRYIAEFYKDSNEEYALTVYEHSLEWAMEFDNSYMFIYFVNDLVKLFPELSINLANKLAPLVYKTVREFPYDANMYSSKTSKSIALIYCVYAFWTVNKTTSLEILNEAVEENINNLDPNDYHNTFELDFSRILTNISNKYDLNDAREVLDAFIESLLKNGKQDLIDKVAMQLIQYGNEKNRPLNKFNISEDRLNKTNYNLLRHILPHCSLSQACYIHRAFSVNEWGVNQKAVKQEIGNVISHLNELNETKDQNYYLLRDSFIINAAVNGIDGCLLALNELSNWPKEFQKNAAYLFVCAIDQMPLHQKEDFISKSWSEMLLLEDFV